MKFQIVPDNVRSQIDPGRARGVRAEWMQALMDGKTIKLGKDDRKRIGGNIKTLKNHGLRLRTGMISDTEIVAWAEPLEASKE